jgi:arylsulfate sulfotransferase
MNSVVYSPADDSIILSGRNQGVAKISRGGEAGATPNAGSKALRWILAAHRGWGKAGWNGQGMDLAPYLLVATAADGTPFGADVQDGTTSSADFGWPFGQHGLFLQADGHLAMFDNGNERDLDLYPGPYFSRGVEYRIDDDASGTGGTITQLWEYGRARGLELYAPVLSNVAVGPVTGNRFVMPGSYTVGENGLVGGAARMVEVTYPAGDVVFEAHLYMNGTQPWDNDVCYRQHRMVLFPP